MGNGNFKILALEDMYHPRVEEGKIYEFIDGKTKWEDASKSSTYESFDDFRKRNPSLKVEEVKELAVDKSINERNTCFKARCVETIDCALTVGKVYEFVDGYSKWDNGLEIPQFCYDGISRINNFNDLIKWFGDSCTKWELVTEYSSFDWDSFKAGKFAVHCDTEEKAKLFFIELMNQGIKWCTGTELNERNNWYFYKGETCYIHGIGGLEYSPMDFFKSINYQIIPYVSNLREVKRPAEVGEWIKIVDAKPAKGLRQNYANGDIFKVSKEEACFENDIEVIGVESFIDYVEYVVLVNYQPQAPLQEEPYKVDWSKVSNKEIAEELLRRYTED